MPWRAHLRPRRFWKRSASSRKGSPWPGGTSTGGRREVVTGIQVVLATIVITLLGGVLYGQARSELSLGDKLPAALPAGTSSPAAVTPLSADDQLANQLEDQLPGLERWFWQPGHCYRWPQVSATVSVKDVPCAEPHLFEAVGPLNLNRAYPAGAPSLSPAQWEEAGERHCQQLITSYLGYPLDPFGRFAVGVIRPDRTGWDQGDRKITCGLTHVTEAGTEAEAEAEGGAGADADADEDALWMMVMFSGAVRGADQAVTYPAGTCIRYSDDGESERVPCEQSHHVQSIGTVTLPALDRTPPSDERFNELARAACAPLADPYLDRRGGDTSLYSNWNLIRPESWQAGTRTTTCMVGRADRAGNPVEKTGLLNPTDAASL